MTSRLFQLALVSLLLALRSVAQPADVRPRLTPEERRQGFTNHTLIAKPKAGASAADLATAETDLGRTPERTFARFGNLRVLQSKAGETIDDTIRRLRATGLYDYVERDYIRHRHTVPNDPRFATDQWSLHNTGQSNGVVGADIGAAAAWDIRTDAPNVIVAVIDTGIRATHEDLAANLWTNAKETAANGVDDDADGYVDDVHGINVLAARGAPLSGTPDDDMGHGTSVASVIGAVGNNGKGMSGVAWKVQIMALKYDDAEGSATASNAVECIDYALAHGVSIINNSYGSAYYSQAEYDAIKRARDAGVIVVTSAGNDSLDNDVYPSYPASYLLDNIVSVAATDRRDALSTFSNYGVAAVDLAAPGTAILTAQNTSDKGYVTYDGTSFSAPMVAGALALLKAQFPNDSYQSLINRLLRATDPLPALAGKTRTGGRLNVGRALTTTTDRPFNDDFAARVALNGTNFTLRAHTFKATAETGEPAHAGLPANGTLWWSWTPTQSGAAVIDTTGSSFDTVVGVYNGTSLAALTSVAANDDAAGATTSRVQFDVTAGTTYQIAVGGKNDATGSLVFALGLAPPNDQFANAIPLSGASFRTSGFNTVSGSEANEPRATSNGKNHTVWYSWIAPFTGTFSFSVFSYGFDAVAVVYSGTTFSNLAPLDSASTQAYNEPALIDVVAGHKYYFQIDSADGNTGFFDLTMFDGVAFAGTYYAQDSTPALSGDYNSLFFADRYGSVAFLNGSTGAIKVATLAGNLDVQSPVVGRDGSIYIGDDVGYFYSYTSAGTLRWRKDLGNVSVTSSAAIGADDAVYVHTDDGKLHGYYTDGTLKWRATVPGDSYSSPSIAPDGTIYIGSSDENLYALSPVDGTLKWKFKADGEIYSTPAIGSGGELYFGTLNSKFYAVNPDGTQRWSYTAGGSISSSPAIAFDGTIYFGCYDHGVYALSSAGAFRWKYMTDDEIRASSPAVTNDGTIYIGSYDGYVHAITSVGTRKRIYATGAYVRSSPLIADSSLFFGSGDNRVYIAGLDADIANSPWPQHRQNYRHTGRHLGTTAPVVYSASVAQVTANAGSATVGVSADGADGISYQWQLNGNTIAAATHSDYTFVVGPALTGIYSATITNSAGSIAGGTTIVGLSSTVKLLGAGTEFPDIVHPNGNVFDQILLGGAAATVTADPGQVLRLSFLDLTDDIVQVEFSGPGALSIVLANASGPVPPAKYNQTTNYMKGHAGIVITGATENTHLSIFSVGRGTAVNQALFKDDVTYDGFADISFVAIASANGKFGGLRTANTSYYASQGFTGIYAPGVQFTGPVFVGDITASANATPVFILGGGSDIRVTGGDLLQPNGHAVQVKGISRLVFAPGSDSHNKLFPAQTNKGRLEQDGVDVTAQIVVNPAQ